MTLNLSCNKRHSLEKGILLVDVAGLYLNVIAALNHFMQTFDIFFISICIQFLVVVNSVHCV